MKRYTATVTYVIMRTLCSARVLARRTIAIKSSAPFAAVYDIAYLKAIAEIPARGVITCVELHEDVVADLRSAS